MSIYVNEAVTGPGAGTSEDPYNSFMEINVVGEVAVSLTVDGSPLELAKRHLYASNNGDVESSVYHTDANASVTIQQEQFANNGSELLAQNYRGVMMRVTLSKGLNDTLAFVFKATEGDNTGSLVQEFNQYRLVRLDRGYLVKDEPDNSWVLTHNADGLLLQSKVSLEGEFMVVNDALYKDLLFTYESLGELKQVFETIKEEDEPFGEENILFADYIFYIKHNMNALFERQVENPVNTDAEIDSGDLLKVVDAELKKSLKRIYMIYRRKPNDVEPDSRVLHLDTTGDDSNVAVQLEISHSDQTPLRDSAGNIIKTVKTAKRGPFNRLFRVYAKERWSIPAKDQEDNESTVTTNITKLYDALSELMTSVNQLPSNPNADPEEAEFGNDIYLQRLANRISAVSNVAETRKALARIIATQHEDYIEQNENENLYDLSKVTLVYTFNYFYDTLQNGIPFEGNSQIYTLDDAEREKMLSSKLRIAIVFQHAPLTQSLE